MSAQIERMINQLNTAKLQILNAVETMKAVAAEDPEFGRIAEAYIIPHILCSTTEDHDYMNANHNIDEWLQSLERSLIDLQEEAEAEMDVEEDDYEEDDFEEESADDLKARFAAFKASNYGRNS